MTIITHSKAWNLPTTVLVVYVVIGYVIACVLPDSKIFSLEIPFNIPIAEVIATHSADPHRVRVFWSFMLAIMPVIFIAFSFLAPIVLTPKKSRALTGKGENLFVFALLFLLGGIVVTPFYFYFIFSNPDVGSPLSKLGRLVAGMAENNLGLFLGGSFILVGLVVAMWMSYVMIPRGMYRIFKGD